jgi:hypothetical protein
MSVTTSPMGCNNHSILVDGVKVGHVYFFRGRNKGQVYTRCFLIGVNGKRVEQPCYAYFKDVIRDLPFLVQEIL